MGYKRYDSVLELVREIDLTAIFVNIVPNNLSEINLFVGPNVSQVLASHIQRKSGVAPDTLNLL